MSPDWPRQDLYVTFRKRLLPDADANLRAIPRKQRAMVRKGMQHGLRSEIDGSARPLLSTSMPTTCIGMARRRCARRYFARLKDVFGDACEWLTIVDAHGVPVSGVMSFYFRDEVLPYYAGDTARRAISPRTISSTGS